MRNTTRLQQVQGGRQVKQSDSSSAFAFILKNANGQDINLDGQTAEIVLYTLDSKLYWQTQATVKDVTVEFTLPGNLVDRDYILEITVGGYVFPSDENIVIRVNKGFAKYMGVIEAYAIRKETREIIKEEAQNATANIAKELDYSQLKGDKGDPGDKGDKGDPLRYEDLSQEQKEELRGKQGDKGDAFTYEDFTEEQLKDLKGEKGDAFTYDDFTADQLQKLKGEKGDAFTYEDFTEEQLEKLKGDRGDSIEVKETTEDEVGNILVTFTDDKQITIPKGNKGDRGEPLKYEDLTEEQKFELKGKDGTMSFEDLTEEQRATLKGDKGDPFEFEDLSEEQKEQMRGPKGEPFTYDDFTQEQLEALKGEQGASITITETSEDEVGNIVIKFSNDTEVTIPRGKALTYDDLTKEQKAELKGEKGDSFTYNDFTPEQLEKLKGKEGKSFTFEDLTPEQKTELKGEKGDPIKIVEAKTVSNGNSYVLFDDGTKLVIRQGEKGDPGEQGGDGENGSLIYSNPISDYSVIRPHIDYFVNSSGEFGPVTMVDSEKGYLAHKSRIKLKGDKGDSITIKEIKNDEDSRETTVNFSDGKSLTIPWGQKGADGTVSFDKLTNAQRKQLNTTFDITRFNTIVYQATGKKVLTDSVADWQKIPSGYYFLTPNVIQGQPIDYGLLRIISWETQFDIILEHMPDGSIYRKSGNHNGFSDWIKIVDAPHTSI
ncbi:hypothetical protein [Anaerococcus cruorum]|uniref:Uncharacterized protein n=1 Tax=Anaerococcus cruorum TaxID=3115617 RepID=A0ABW9MWC1_9FIRM